MGRSVVVQSEVGYPSAYQTPMLMKTSSPFAFSLFLWLSLLAFSSYAQSESSRFEYLTERDGLSNNDVSSILQDREGFMWFGTKDGLNKYDGYTFTVLRPDVKNPEHTLHSSNISDIHEDRKGRLWIATMGGGLHQLDKHTGKMTHYEIKPANMPIWQGLHTIYEDREGILWIGAIKGIVRFDPATQQSTLYFPPDETIWFSAVVEDDARRLWASCEKGIYQLDQYTGKFTPMVLDSSLAQQPSCDVVYLDNEGVLWAGTRGEGLFRMNTRRNPLHFTRYDPPGCPSKNFISY